MNAAPIMRFCCDSRSSTSSACTSRISVLLLFLLGLDSAADASNVGPRCLRGLETGMSGSHFVGALIFRPSRPALGGGEGGGGGFVGGNNSCGFGGFFFLGGRPLRLGALEVKGAPTGAVDAGASEDSGEAATCNTSGGGGDSDDGGGSGGRALKAGGADEEGGILAGEQGLFALFLSAIRATFSAASAAVSTLFFALSCFFFTSSCFHNSF